MNSLFPENDLLIIAEPGRYFAHAAATSFVNITSKRAVNSPQFLPTSIEAISSDEDTDLEDHIDNSIEGYRYYVNDGVYGTFNAVICDHRENLSPSYILDNFGNEVKFGSLDEPTLVPMYDCSIWGNSCDGIDKISDHVRLPSIPLGFWLVFKNMGAYTTSAASAGFNGFPIAKKFYVNSEM